MLAMEGGRDLRALRQERRQWAGKASVHTRQGDPSAGLDGGDDVVAAVSCSLSVCKRCTRALPKDVRDVVLSLAVDAGSTKKKGHELLGLLCASLTLWLNEMSEVQRVAHLMSSA